VSLYVKVPCVFILCKEICYLPRARGAVGLYFYVGLYLYLFWNVGLYFYIPELLISEGGIGPTNL
jgi:hypothetical protein